MAVVVQFMSNLLHNEQAAFPELRPDAIDQNLDPGDYIGIVAAPNAEERVDGVLQAADESGIARVCSVWEIVQKIRAMDRGEKCEPLVHDWFSRRWKGSRRGSLG